MSVPQPSKSASMASLLVSWIHGSPSFMAFYIGSSVSP